MSAVAVLDAERIKLSTTKSPLWTAGVVAVLSLGLAALQGVTAYDYTALPPEKAAIGVAVFGVPVLMILASMSVTSEYRTSTIRTTFMATPNRALVLVAKAVVAAIVSGVYTALMVVASIIVARMFAEPFVGGELSLSQPSSWRAVGAISLYAVLAAVLGVGVGALVRHAAAAVAVLLLWPLLVEPVIGNLPNVGTEVGPYLPFVNVFLFLGVPWLYPPYVMHWGVLGSLVYFTLIVAVAFVAAIVVVNRRDA
jgi:ABC-2 type transport system permease protein